MTFSRIVEAIAATTGVPKTKVAAVLRSFFSIVRENVMSGSSVTLSGLGRFYPVVMKDRNWFGGKTKGKDSTHIRFKESHRHGKAGSRRRRREDEDRGHNRVQARDLPGV